MKFIRSLSSIALLSCLSINSGAAVAKMTEQISNPISTGQTEPVMIAGFFNILQDGVQTIQQVDQAIDAVDSIIEREKRRKELEAARQAATEQQRLEAQRRQQYFESLSPQEQKAYMAEQRAMQAQHDAVATLFILGLMSLMSGESSSQPEPAKSPDYDYIEECKTVEGVRSCTMRPYSIEN